MNFADFFIKPTPSLAEMRAARFAVAIAHPAPAPSLPSAKLLAIAILVAVLGVILALSASYVLPSKALQDKPDGIIDVGRASDYAPGSVTHFIEGKFWLVRLESGEFIALSNTDPWRGCTVPWRADMLFGGKTGWFRDPCGGSTYDIEGRRVFGPSQRDMDRFPVFTQSNHIIVNTKTPILGSTTLSLP